MPHMLLSDQHTILLAVLAHTLSGDRSAIPPGRRISQSARILRSLNNASMRVRYGERFSPQYLTRAQLARSVKTAPYWIRNATHADIFKAAECFKYQCTGAPSDHPGRLILASVLDRAASLPGAAGPSSVWAI